MKEWKNMYFELTETLKRLLREKALNEVLAIYTSVLDVRDTAERLEYFKSYLQETEKDGKKCI